MISADDAEYPREYRTLGNGTRRFSNVGLVHTSERRHTVIAAQSLEALTGLQKSEMERKRDAFMDHLKNKYPQHALALRGQQERMRDQVRGRLLGEGGDTPPRPVGLSGGAGAQQGPGCSMEWELLSPRAGVPGQISPALGGIGPAGCRWRQQVFVRAGRGMDVTASRWLHPAEEGAPMQVSAGFGCS